MDKGTRDIPRSRVPSREYLANWDKIFNNNSRTGKEEQKAEKKNKESK